MHHIQSDESCQRHYHFREELSAQSWCQTDDRLRCSGFTYCIGGVQRPQCCGLLILSSPIGIRRGSVASVANSRKDLALLVGTSLLGLGAIEAFLSFFGV